jgi:hypothetical protein
VVEDEDETDDEVVDNLNLALIGLSSVVHLYTTVAATSRWSFPSTFHRKHKSPVIQAGTIFQMSLSSI